jgi:AAA domain
MAIHKKAAVSYGNDWLQTFSQPIPWIWEGVVAQEAVTLLSAPEKTGKTTLLSLLLDRRREGGQLLGRTVQPGRTILCSEENDRLWALRQPPLNFGSPNTTGRWASIPAPGAGGAISTICSTCLRTPSICW